MKGPTSPSSIEVAVCIRQSDTRSSNLADCPDPQAGIAQGLKEQTARMAKSSTAAGNCRPLGLSWSGRKQIEHTEWAFELDGLPLSFEHLFYSL